MSATAINKAETGNIGGILSSVEMTQRCLMVLMS